MQFLKHKTTKILLAVFAVVLSVGLAYPLLASIKFSGTIVVPGVNTWQIANTNYLQGGHMQITATSSALGLTLRNQITPERRSTGMLVTVIIAPTATSSGTGSATYRLVSNRPASTATTTTADVGSCVSATATSSMIYDGSLDGTPANNSVSIGGVTT